MKHLVTLPLLALSTLPLLAQTRQAPSGDSWWDRYEQRVSATQGEQPHWITPLVTVTPRLEQEVRADFVHQYSPERKAAWNYGNGKGLEIIPERHTEIIFIVPPFLNHVNGGNDGFGDTAFLLKERLLSRNEEHGNGIITAFLGASVPTGKNGNGGCCAVVTPTLAVGKGYRLFDWTSTAGGSLPVTNAKKLGHAITWNNTLQMRAAHSGTARLFWPEIEFNTTFYKGGAHDGNTAVYATPGLVIGRVPLRHTASGAPGRLGLTFGAGEQIALTHFNTYNHATILTVRIPF